MENEKLTQRANSRGNGYIFKPKYKTRSGEARESKFFYIQFYRNGVRYVENTHTDKITPAKSLLRRRLGSEEFVPPTLEKVTFDELAAGVITDYEKNERSSLPRVRRSISYLTKFFRGQRAININGAMASEYAVLRRKRPGDEGACD